MKNPTYPMPIYFSLGLALMGAVAWLVSAMLQTVPTLVGLHWGVLLIPAILFSVGALIITLRAKERTGRLLLSYGLNAVGSGWAVGVLMGVKGILPATALVYGLLPALALGILCWVILATVDHWPGILTLIFVLLSLALLIVGVVIWTRHVPLIGCAMVFSALFLLPYCIAVNAAMDNPKEMFSYLSLSGFGAFVIIFFVVLVVLTEGDGLEALFDGLDVSGGGGEGIGRRKRNR